MSVRSLAYIGLAVKDLAAFEAFATRVLGLMPASSAGGALRLRMDDHAWRFHVEAGEADDVAFLGLEAAGAAELEALARRLREGGVAVHECGAEHLADRGVLGMFVCEDPDGLPIEIFYGASLRTEAPFASPAGVAHFVTGAQGVGHAALSIRDVGAGRRFYQDLLGFRPTDIIRLPLPSGMVADLEFFHCNARHHSLVLAPIPGGKRLRHFMVQVPRLDDVGFALERALAAGVPIVQSLGRHTNDRMVSFYSRAPAGFDVEVGFGAQEVDDATWHVVRHDAGSSWGHKRAPAA